MAFATATQLAELLNRTLDAGETAQAELLLDMATEAIRAECRQTITEATTTATLRGTWARDLELPERPVTAVASVAVDDTALLDEDWEWDGKHTLRRLPAYDLELVEDLDDTAVRQGARTYYGGGHWGGPRAVVTVTYTHGHPDVPALIENLCLTLAARSLANPGGVAQESLGSYAVTYGRDSQSPGVVVTEADRRLLRRAGYLRGC